MKTFIDIIVCELPFLLSKSEMKASRAKIDSLNDKIYQVYPVGSSAISLKMKIILNLILFLSMVWHQNHMKNSKLLRIAKPIWTSKLK